MPESDRCELHEVAIFDTPEASEALLRLAQSPMGDECQRCAVCRSAREYVEIRLAERSGRATNGVSGEAAWRKLQAAVASARSSVHPLH